MTNCASSSTSSFIDAKYGFKTSIQGREVGQGVPRLRERHQLNKHLLQPRSPNKGYTVCVEGDNAHTPGLHPD